MGANDRDIPNSGESAGFQLLARSCPRTNAGAEKITDKAASRRQYFLAIPITWIGYLLGGFWETEAILLGRYKARSDGCHKDPVDFAAAGIDNVLLLHFLVC